MPKSKLSAVQRDLDLVERFPCITLDGIDFVLCSSMAATLQLNSPRNIGSFAEDNEHRQALIQWRSEFILGFTTVDPDMIDAVSSGLGEDESVGSATRTNIQKAVWKLRGFLSDTNCNTESILEYVADFE